ncbi:hypothetical protein ACOMHN_042915 [Nucella lapillus]
MPLLECGGFIGMSSTSTGTILSPGYPGSYPNYTRCIWIVEAPANYVAQLTVNFVGETYNSACSDYVEFRDGGQTGDVIQTTCGTLTSSQVTSTARWMYVFFTSDGVSQANGLSATYAAVYVGSASINSSVADPTRECRSYEFECGNKLCISLSYRCDGFYDCGCGEDCDEYGCSGISISKSEQMAIGFCLGIVVFLVAATLGRRLEKHRNWEKERGGPSSNGRAAEQNGVRMGWSSGKKNKIKSGYTPQNINHPTTPRVSPCTIRMSEIA